VLIRCIHLLLAGRWTKLCSIWGVVQPCELYFGYVCWLTLARCNIVLPFLFHTGGSEEFREHRSTWCC